MARKITTASADILECQVCHLPVHITEYDENGIQLPDPMDVSIDEYVIAHFRVCHPIRARLIRWLSGGWFT